MVALLGLPGAVRAQQAAVAPAPVPAQVQSPVAPAQPGPQQAVPAPSADAPGAAASEPQAAPPPVARPAKPENLFDALGRWFDKSAADFKASIDQSNARWRELSEKNEKAVRDAAAAQREAAEALKKLPNTRVVEGRKVCEIARNGAPDCQAAAEEICRSRGFTTGKSADIETTRRCSAKAWITRNEKVCKDETMVVKATCQ